MITIKEIGDERPHLKETLRLYEKVVKFKLSTVDLNKNPISVGDIAYPPDLIGPVFERFSATFDIPEDILTPLQEAMKFGQIDFTRLPMNEIPAFSLPYHADELAGILFLMSKPYFLWLGKSYDISNKFWEEGRCPVCNSVPSVSFIKKDEGRRLHCSFCESSGPWHRIGCPNCQGRDSHKIDIITAEEEKGFRIELCNECKSYMKTTEEELLSNYSPELLDIISLPLDIIAQNKGYKRHSPNPVGMMKMV